MSNVFSDIKGEDNFASTVAYEVVKTTERAREVALLLAKEKRLAVDTENSGLEPHEGWPLLLQIGTKEKCYIFEHYRTIDSTLFPSFERAMDLAPIKSILADEGIVKILFNAKYDWKWIYKHYDTHMANIFCCQVAERITTVGLPSAKRRPSLADVSRKYCNITMSKAVRSAFINRDPEADPISSPEFEYSAGDVALLFDIMDAQKKVIEKYELQEAMSLENEVLPVVAKAEVAGVVVEKEKWEELIKRNEKRYNRISQRVYECFDSVLSQRTLFGVPPFKIGSQQQLLKNLERLGFELKDTEEKTLKKSIIKFENRPHAEVFKNLLDWRETSTRRTRYGKKFLAMVSSATGRLHCQFNQVMADTGRMSSSKPNLQQIPGYDPDDEDSINFRGCFTARPGYKLVTADYSQQELRILAELSGDETFARAYTTFDDEGNALDVHRYTASVVFEVPYKDVTEGQRKQAKVINFFLVYGGSAYSLAETLKITEEEAQGVIDDYFKRYGQIKKFLDNSASTAIHCGYSETISGRKRFLTLPPTDDPLFEKIRKKIKRVATNNPIQGGGADVTKKGMVFVDRALRAANLDATILMIIHDELVVEVREDQAEETARLVEEEMVRGYSYFFKKIPMRVDAHISSTWEK